MKTLKQLNLACLGAFAAFSAHAAPLDAVPVHLAQLTDKVGAVVDAVAGVPKTEERKNSEKPVALLQVFSKRVVVYAQPEQGARPVGELFKGQMVDAFEQQGNWYRIRIQDSLLADTTGWIEQGDGEEGDEVLGVFAPRAEALDSLSANKPSGIRPGINATEPVLNANREPVIRAIPGKSLETLPKDIVTPIVDPSQVEPPQANLPRESIAIPDRWRIMQSLGFKYPLYDPYHQNPLKADLPVLQDVLGPNWFFNLGVISDSLIEERRIPVPVSPTSSTVAGQANVFGRGDQTLLAQNLIVSLSLIKGDTTFRPPDYEFRLTPVFNYTDVRTQEDRLLKIDPVSGTLRQEGFVGIQEAFVDYHLRNVSARYDFDSVRVGIQPFISDFRGFLFQDLPFGIRFFGNRDNNIYQYNLAYFKRVEKDTNSGLNDITEPLRDDSLFVANLYRQDFPFVGFTSQVSYIHNRNTEGNNGLYYDNNGFLARPASLGDQRPHNYRVNYFGYSGDGHYGRLNITTSTYLATGKVDHDVLAHRPLDIEAFFHATEISRDFDWFRLKGNFLYASGDKNPYDGKAQGFDAIFENPQFAGADTSFFIRQSIPLIGGGGVVLSGRNGLLPDLRSSKEQGQSNFVNPGLILLGVGTDLDLTPELRLVANVNKLKFADTTILGVLRQRAPPSADLGIDASIGFQFRPLFSQNIVINGSIARLFPDQGYKDLFDNNVNRRPYSLLFNVILTF